MDIRQLIPSEFYTGRCHVSIGFNEIWVEPSAVLLGLTINSTITYSVENGGMDPIVPDLAVFFYYLPEALNKSHERRTIHVLEGNGFLSRPPAGECYRFINVISNPMAPSTFYSLFEITKFDPDFGI